jgi:hypothetical protein
MRSEVILAVAKLSGLICSRNGRGVSGLNSPSLPDENKTPAGGLFLLLVIRGSPRHPGARSKKDVAK